MSKANGALGAVGKVITYILVVLLVLGIAGMVTFFVLRSQGVTFYVECYGEKYLANGYSDSLALLNGETHTFSVKSLTDGEVNYSVKVTSNGANNFTFTTGGEIWHLWNDDTEKDDYTDIFDIEKSTDNFTLTIPDHFTVEKAVEQKFGAEIVLQDESDIQDDLCYFVLIVSVDESTVRLPFSFSDLAVTLSPSEIVF